MPLPDPKDFRERDPVPDPAEPAVGPLEADDPESPDPGDSDADLEPWEDDDNVMESDDSPQPYERNGVPKDMASIVLDQTTWQGRRPGASTDPVSLGGFVADWSVLSDSDIMLRVREGDDSGFNHLIEKYRNPIIHFMFRMVHNQAVAEELAQEVFLRVYRSRHTYRAEARFTTWLYRIATNLGVNHARDTKHERTAQNVYLDQPDPETGVSPDVADSRTTAEEDLVRDERMRAIRKHVMALPERQRTAVLMHKYQDMDYKEIGAVLKLSESATKSLLFRAYQTLRERLKDFVTLD
jgi:RNA polymerase sigma-70 factor, ECF subfamily